MHVNTVVASISTKIHLILRMSRSDLKDQHQSRPRHFLTDRYQLYWVSCHAGVFTSEAFMHSNAASVAIVNSPSLLCSTELHVCRAGLSPAHSETPHTMNGSKAQYETVSLCYLRNFCALVSFINAMCAENVQTTVLPPSEKLLCDRLFFYVHHQTLKTHSRNRLCLLIHFFLIFLTCSSTFYAKTSFI